MAASPALGASDCEAIHAGFLAQPANAISSLAFTAVGIAIGVWAARVEGFERRYRLVLGAVLAVAGIGSFLYHGPQYSYSAESHDWSLLVVVSLVATTLAFSRLEMSEALRWGLTAGVSLVAVTVAVLMGTPNAVFGVMVSVAVIADVLSHRGTPRRRAAYVWVLAAAAAAIVAFLLGRTDSVLCDPPSPFQLHAVWHVLAAIALGLYTYASEPVRARIRAR